MPGHDYGAGGDSGWVAKNMLRHECLASEFR